MGLFFEIAAVLAVIFIFQGDPDLWDKWHDQAMGKPCAAAEIGKQKE
jgi:hypothetical protein